MMFKREFADVISKTGMVPLKDLRPLLIDRDLSKVTELELLKFDFFDDVKFAKLLANKYKIPFMESVDNKILSSNLALLKKGNVIKYRCIPIKKTNKAVSVAIYDPTMAKGKEELQVLLQYPVEFCLISLSSWKEAYDQVRESITEILEHVREVKVDDDQDMLQKDNRTEEEIGHEVITYVNKILVEAYLKKASDIHVEIYEKVFRIRFRIDGTLQEYHRPKLKMAPPIISRIKLLAQMDISEKRRPQDGRIKLAIGENVIDLRVSSLPTLFGEKVVLRILDSVNLQTDLTKLGIEKTQLEKFQRGIIRPYGMCLVTGPTGSGKTTTMYSALSELNQEGKNLSTIEDPVEFNLLGINQVNVNKEAGLTFASALKSFLRQDPDILMVGEIRDLEVGEIAVEAALTGHLLLSTLHTNDAPSTVTRLLNMGIQPFLIVACLNVIIAQRLCRMICTHCREIQDIPEKQLIDCGISPESSGKVNIYKGKGCNHCGRTGYSGRVAIHEVMELTPSVKKLILKEASTQEIKGQAIRDGMKSLRMSALTKVVKGLTTLEEAIINSASD